MSPLSDGIGSLNESSLHLAIKDWYSKPADRFEVKVDGSVIDIVRGPLLIEIQTRNFSGIRRKLEKLIDHHKILLLYPIPALTWIIRISASGEVLGKRKSPKRGKLVHIFDELLHIPEIINHPNFTLEVLMVKMEEVRCDDGGGSRRRKGVSIRDKRLVEIIQSISFNRNQDFLRFLPDALASPFTNKDFARAAGISGRQATRITYTLRRMGVLEKAGKKGKAFLFQVAL